VLSSDLDYLSQAPWAPFIPGALIAITVGALNALADAFRDRAGADLPPLSVLVAADPRLTILEDADDPQRPLSA
jgi:hypothetical protein